MTIHVYVEGPSDREALARLLDSLIAEGREKGVGIRFYPQGSKAELLDDCPRRGAKILAQEPSNWVFLVPDLYPMQVYKGTKNEHSSFRQLKELLLKRFAEEADGVRLSSAARQHFRVHCLKHDLEALILAAQDQLRRRLRTKDTLGKWRKPVEDQDDNAPPKRVVEQLFRKYRGRGYRRILDAPWILERASLTDLERLCPQNFAPLVKDIRDILAASSQSQSPRHFGQ